MELAEALVEVVKLLWDPISNCWRYHKRLDDYMDNLNTRLEELNSRKEDIALRLSVEVVRGNSPKKEVELWLRSVDTVNREAKSIQQEFDKGKFLSRASLARQVFRKIEDVVELHQKGNFADLVIDAPAQDGEIMPTTTLIGQTAKRKLDEVWTWMMDDCTRKIGIYGIGGSGKTTIMKHINNRILEDSDKFSEVIWVTVSKTVSLSNLQRDIASAVNLDFASSGEETRMATKLFSLLKRKKTWVLVLDDMWEAFSLTDVGIPEPTADNGCKLVLTTRSLEVCRSMGCKDIKMDLLTEEEAWDLFIDEVGKRILLNSKLETIARKVAARCARLPLAVITVARSMKGVEDIYDWRNALQELTESMKGLNNMDKVHEQLKFSYTHLKDDKLRQCILFCSLYPDDFQIKRKELIKYMIAEGIMDEMRSREAAIDMGHAILNKLENASLLETSNDGTYVKMHDLIRDMVINITSNDHRYLVEAGMQLRELPDEKRWAEELEKLSLLDNHISVIPESFSPKCQKLHTLLLARNKELSQVPESFFANMTSLKLLDLSRTGIKRLPDSISDLGNLVALYLKHCRQLRFVPSVANLTALKELDLRYVGMRRLPQGMDNLTSLRYLNLHKSNIIELPVGLLSKLSHLEYIKVWPGTTTFKVNGEELVSLKKLETFEGQTSNVSTFNAYIKHLRGEKLKCHLQLGHGDYPKPREFKYVVRIVEYSINQETELLLPSNVEFLSFDNCSGIISLSDISPIGGEFCFDDNGITGSENTIVFPTSSSSYSASKSEEAITSQSAFSCLRVLCIDSCPDLKNLFKPGLILQFELLEEVYIYDCLQMENIFTNVRTDNDESETVEVKSNNQTLTESSNVNNNIAFPNLRKFYLARLPKLVSIHNGKISCPSLICMTICGCPKLKNIPLALPERDGKPVPPSKLEELYVDRMWWELLELDKPEFKSSLQPFRRFLDEERER